MPSCTILPTPIIRPLRRNTADANALARLMDISMPTERSIATGPSAQLRPEFVEEVNRYAKRWPSSDILGAFSRRGPQTLLCALKILQAHPSLPKPYKTHISVILPRDQRYNNQRTFRHQFELGLDMMLGQLFVQSQLERPILAYVPLLHACEEFGGFEPITSRTVNILAGKNFRQLCAPGEMKNKHYPNSVMLNLR